MYAASPTRSNVGFRPGVVGMGYYGGGRLNGIAPRRRHGRIFLGQVDPTSIADAIMPQASISNVPGFNEGAYEDILQSAQTGQIAGFTQTCTGIAPSNSAQIAGQAGQLSVSMGSKIIASTAPALAAGPVGLIIFGVGALIGLFASIFEEHARAVAKEQQTECAAVPAFNNGAQAISAAVQNGTLSPAQGSAAIAQLLSEFLAQIAPIERNDAQNCNAGCIWHKCAEAATQGLQAQFSEMSSGTSSTASPAQSSSPAPASWFSQETIVAGVPNFVLAAGAALLLFWVMQK